MIEALSNERLLQVLLSGGFVLGVAIMSIRRQIAGMVAEGLPQQHPLLRAIETAAAIGIGAVWTALIYTGPSLTEVSHGQGRVLHWTGVLLRTALWLAYRFARGRLSPRSRPHFFLLEQSSCSLGSHRLPQRWLLAARRL